MVFGDVRNTSLNSDPLYIEFLSDMAQTLQNERGQPLFALRGQPLFAIRAENISQNRAGADFEADGDGGDVDYECCEKFVKIAIITSKYVSAIFASILAIALFPITVAVITGVACACEENGYELNEITDIFCRWLNDCTSYEIHQEENPLRRSSQDTRPTQVSGSNRPNGTSYEIHQEENPLRRSSQDTRPTQVSGSNRPNGIERNPSQQEMKIDFPRNQQMYVAKEEDDEKTREFCTYFNQNYRNLELDFSCGIPFEELYNDDVLNSRIIANPCTYFLEIPQEDFIIVPPSQGLVAINGPQIRQALSNHDKWRELARDGLLAQDALSKTYVNTIFNLLTFLKGLAEIPQKDRNAKDKAIEKYRNYFTGIIHRMYETFNDGCAFNQISHLNTIIADILNENSSIGMQAGFEKSLVVFSAALNRYQIATIHEIVVQAPRQSQFQHIYNYSEYYRREGVELEFVIRRNLHLIKANFTAHYFENSLTQPIRDWVVDEFWKQYTPLKFFYEMLTQSPSPGFITANFHAQICDWYDKEEGMDVTLEKYAFLRKEGSEQEEYWLSEQAVVYYFMKNGFLKASA